MLRTAPELDDLTAAKIQRLTQANPTTWRLVAMNLAIRGMGANLGKEPADTFSRNQHPDLRADYTLAKAHDPCRGGAGYLHRENEHFARLDARL